MKVLGIESTAHTFGVGVVEDGKIVLNNRDMYRPACGGILPREAAEHHANVAWKLIPEGSVDYVAYSAGPGLGPCLKIGTLVARYLAIKMNVPMVPVNHAIAHIEVGMLEGQGDPVVVYTSGGNTMVLANRNGWKVFGETLDIALGNALDKLARKMGLPHPGGPKLEALASRGNKLLKMPYVVKGMDLSYSGILTHSMKLLEKESRENVAYSFQEHAFAMLVEVAERALAHTGKEELLLVGGVAQNSRLREMFRTMCEDRGAEFRVAPPEVAGDNGAMIAYSGYLRALQGKTISPQEARYFQKLRVTDEPLEKLKK